MPVSQRVLQGVTILDIDGRMTINAPDQLIRDTVRGLLDDGCRDLLLNLQRVPYIDSTGLANIIESYTTTLRRGGALKLLHVAPAVQQLLAVTMLLPVFELFDSEPDALASFAAPRRQ